MLLSASAISQKRPAGDLAATCGAPGKEGFERCVRPRLDLAVQAQRPGVLEKSTEEHESPEENGNRTDVNPADAKPADGDSTGQDTVKQGLTARIVDGDLIHVNLAGVDAVGQAKFRIGEALGERPEEIAVFDGDGIQLEDSLPLKTITSELLVMVVSKPSPLANIADNSPASFSLEQSRALTAKMVNGDLVNVNLTAVETVRQAKVCIAEALGDCPEAILVIGGDGTELEDGRLLRHLPISELQVMIARAGPRLGPLESKDMVDETAKARAVSRLTQEFQRFEHNTPPEFVAEVADGDAQNSIFCWRVHFPLPKGILHSDNLCEIIVRMPLDYPLRPPELHVVSSVQHWVISAARKVQMDLLCHEWTPAVSVYQLVLGFQSLLREKAPTALAWKFFQELLGHEAGWKLSRSHNVLN